MSLFTAATRLRTKARIAMTGVTGAGKTLSALYLAYGLSGDWNKIALIDTEHERARLYANNTEKKVGKFLYAPLEPPYSPERYIQYVIEGTKAVGSDGVVIVDSLSHAWDAAGGVLEMKEKIAAQAGKNSYTAWQEAGIVQKNLLNSLLSVDCHTILTMRSKMDYVMQENDKGKMAPVKVGLMPIQRDDTEYEFDIVFDINRNHKAKVTKDTTFLDEFYGVITHDLGIQLRNWLNDGESEPERCQECGKVITATKSKTVEEIIAGTFTKTGEMLCMSCYKKWLEQNEPATLSS